MQEKCRVSSACRINLKGEKSRCSGAFKAKLMEGEVPLMEGLDSSALIGECFTVILNDTKTCKDRSETQIEDMLDGVNVPSEEMIKEVREQFKA